MDITESTTHELQAVLGALNNAQAMIWFDPDGYILDANENFCRALGYRLDEIVGKHHRMFVEPSYAQSEAYRDFWRKLKDGGVVADDFVRYAKNGSKVYLVASYNSLRDETGQVSKVVKLALDMTKSREKEARLLNAVRQASDAISSEVEAITTTSNELSKRTETQAATVEETSAAMEEISATVNSNVQNAERATAEARMAKEQAENGSEVVENAIAAMGKIENGSKEIRKFIEVIDSIAFQTNLLALNAGVEAARAGDAGRGFAVVASEVRALAQRASESAKDINALIDTSTREVEEGARLVNETGAVLNQIMEGVSKVSDGIESIYTASREQAGGVQEITQSISNIDKDTQRNANMSQENAESAANLARSAADLVEAIGGGRSAPVKPPMSHSKPRAAAPLPPKETPASPAPPPPSSVRKLAVNAPAVNHDPDEDAWTEF